MTFFHTGRIGPALKALLVAVLLTFAAPLAASAAVFTIDAGSLVYTDEGGANLDLIGVGTNNSDPDDVVYRFFSPFVVTGSAGNSFNPQTAESFLAFCLNPFADAPMGTGLNLAYFDGSVDPSVVVQITDLVDYGNDLYNAGPLADVRMQLAAVQGAIWQVLFPSFTFTGLYDMESASYAEPLTSLIASYAAVGGVPHASGNLALRVLRSDRQDLQDLAIQVTTGTPEPEAWALMIVGFFGSGLLIRRRRATFAA